MCMIRISRLIAVAFVVFLPFATDMLGANAAFKILSQDVSSLSPPSLFVSDTAYPWVVDTNKPVYVEILIADVDRTLTNTGDSELEGTNLSLITQSLLAGKKVILITGSPYHEKYAGLNFEREAIRRRIVDILLKTLERLGHKEKMQNLVIRYISGKGRVTFDKIGNESIVEVSEKLIPDPIALQIARAQAAAFLLAQRDQTVEGFQQSALKNLIWQSTNLVQLEMLIRAESGVEDVRFWPMGTELTLVFLDPKTRAGERVFELSQKILEANGIGLSKNEYFFSGGAKFSKVARIKKQDVILEELANIRPKGAVLALGDSNTDDFLKLRPRGTIYFSFYLGKTKDVEDYPHIVVIRDKQGMDGTYSGGFAPVVDAFLQAERNQETYGDISQKPLFGGEQTMTCPLGLDRLL